MQKKTKNFMISLIVIVLIGFILSACRSSEPEFDIDAQKTGFAQTADVQASLTAAAQPTATETPLPLPTYTPTIIVTNTPVNTPKPENEATAPPAAGVNRAQVIGQTPDDNTRFKPSEAFTVTWTVDNRGTTTWSVNYYVEFAFGEQMGAQDKVYIWLPVSPETNLPISVNLVAPETPGTYVSNWKLFDQNGTAFYDLSVTIIVGE